MHIPLMKLIVGETLPAGTAPARDPPQVLARRRLQQVRLGARRVGGSRAHGELRRARDGRHALGPRVRRVRVLLVEDAPAKGAEPRLVPAERLCGGGG